ncbi:MAG TPA: copper resistance CopC family protein, partial [Ktedonobacteraceae bacterium]|nr:copper resistance CopC family protein [Ktedonobacteraceae bacterium]
MKRFIVPIMHAGVLPMSAFLLASIIALSQQRSALARPLHAALLRSEPGVGSVVLSSPAQVCLWFSEAVQPVGESIIVLDPTGVVVQHGRLRIQETEACIPMRTTISGTYLLQWQVVS